MEETVQNTITNPEAVKTLTQMAGGQAIFLPEDPDEEAFIGDDEAMDFNGVRLEV